MKIMKMMKNVISYTAAVLLAGVTGNIFSEDVQLYGPGAGGACYALAVDPRNPDVIIGGLDMGFAFRTDNGGQSWTVLGAGSENPGYRGCFQAAFAPSNPDIVWIASEHGGYRSDDNGKTFRRMTASLGGAPGHWQGITIDPADPRKVYLFQGSKVRQRPGSWSHGRLVWTQDGGQSWQELSSPTGHTPRSGLHNLVVDPTSPIDKRRLFCTGDNSVYRSDDGGISWQEITQNLPFPSDAKPAFGIIDLAVMPGGGIRLFTTVMPGITASGKVFGGVFRSMDGGKTWRESNQGLKRHVSSRNNAWILRSSQADPNRCYLGTLDPGEIYRSDDGGSSWRLVTFPGTRNQVLSNEDGTSTVFLINDGSGNYRHSFLWRIDSLIDTAVSDSNPDIFIYCDNIGYTMTSDGGKTWRDISFDYTDEYAPNVFGKINPVRFTHRIQNRGLHLLCAVTIKRDPFQPETMYAGYMDHGLMISRDGGKTWESARSGLKTKLDVGWGWCHSVTVDRQVPGRVYATFGGDRVYQSNDHGWHWQEIGPSEATGPKKAKCATSGIVIDYDTPPEHRTLYFAADKGIYKSTDGGKSWKRKVKGLGNATTVTSLVKTGSKLWAGSHLERVGGHSVTAHGLFLSCDGGESWKIADPELFSRRITAIDYCRSAPENIYVVALDGKGYWSNGTIYRSCDGGKSWEKVAGGKLYRHIAVNPENPNYIYTKYAVWDLNRDTPSWLVSANGGKSWQTIAPEQPKCGGGFGILIDEIDPRKVFFCEPFAICEFHDISAPGKKKK